MGTPIQTTSTVLPTSVGFCYCSISGGRRIKRQDPTPPPTGVEPYRLTTSTPSTTGVEPYILSTSTASGIVTTPTSIFSSGTSPVLLTQSTTPALECGVCLCVSSSPVVTTTAYNPTASTPTTSTSSAFT